MSAKRITSTLLAEPRPDADMFCREAQAAWPELRPYFDPKATAGAERLGLPTATQALARLCAAVRYHRFAAALVRTAHRGRSAGRDIVVPPC